MGCCCSGLRISRSALGTTPSRGAVVYCACRLAGTCSPVDEAGVYIYMYLRRVIVHLHIYLNAPRWSTYPGTMHIHVYAHTYIYIYILASTHTHIYISICLYTLNINNYAMHTDIIHIEYKLCSTSLTTLYHAPTHPSNLLSGAEGSV